MATDRTNERNSIERMGKEERNEKNGAVRVPANNVPAPIADLMKAETFDVSKHRVDSFRATAQRQAGGALEFALGKPTGLTQGLALLTKKDAQIRVNLIMRRFGKAVRFAAPTVEFEEPELSQYLEPVHLVPVVNVTGSAPSAHLMPFRVTAWDGYETLFTALQDMEDASQGLFLQYQRGSGDAPGGYLAEPFDMTEAQITLWEGTQWPSADDVLRIVPSESFETLAGENYCFQRGWRRVLDRKGGAQ